jgi:hypothetical protein
MQRLRIYGIFILLFLEIHSLPAQWKLAASNVIKAAFRPYNGGGVLRSHNGTLWVGYQDVWMSSDTGKSWSLRSPFNGFNNNCVKDISFFDDNTGLVTTQDGEIYITHDKGLSWTQHIPPHPYRNRPSIESAVFLGTPNNILACSYHGDRFVSNDGGTSWKLTISDSVASQVLAGIGGTGYFLGGLLSGAWLYETNDFGATWLQHPTQIPWDSYSFIRDKCDTSFFYLANDDLAARSDNFSRIFISSNAGTSWNSSDTHKQPYHCGSVSYPIMQYLSKLFPALAARPIRD